MYFDNGSLWKFTYEIISPRKMQYVFDSAPTKGTNCGEIEAAINGAFPALPTASFNRDYSSTIIVPDMFS